MVIAPQSKKSFPAKIDFITSPGHLTGGAARAECGLPGAGPERVITDLALYGFEKGEMVVESLHPGTTLDQVRGGLGWDPKVATKLATTSPPSAAELTRLRNELDPRRLYL